MSVIAECVYLKHKENNGPEKPNWDKGAEKKQLTWKMIKKELFSKESKEESEDEDEPCQRFDALEDEASSGGEESSDEEAEGAKATSRRSSQYCF